MKALKKSICLLLCLGTMTLCTACSGEEKAISEKELMQQGMELVEQMDTLAESGAYTQSMTNSEEVSSLIEKFGEEEFAEPEKVSRVLLPAEAFDAWFSEMSGETLSEDVREIMENKLMGGIFGTINGMEGVDMIAVSGTLTTSRVFDAGTQQQNQLWAYQFPGEYSVLVSFVFQEDGLAEATAYPVKTETLSSMEGGLGQWLGETLKMDALTEEEISIS